MTHGPTSPIALHVPQPNRHHSLTCLTYQYVRHPSMSHTVCSMSYGPVFPAPQHNHIPVCPAPPTHLSSLLGTNILRMTALYPEDRLGWLPAVLYNSSSPQPCCSAISSGLSDPPISAGNDTTPWESYKLAAPNGLAILPKMCAQEHLKSLAFPRLEQG